MSRSRWLHLGLCTCVAASLTCAAVLLDEVRATEAQKHMGLLWARQVASQAEGLFLKAREAKEPDPLSWAINYLSQGVEPRVMRVTRIHAQDGRSRDAEIHALDRATGVFDYTRILMPENGSGVRITLALGYQGFLGSRSLLDADLAMLLVYWLFFVIAFLKTGRYFGFDDTRTLRALVSGWVRGARSELTRHGSHVRDVIRQSRELVLHSVRARELVNTLRERIHAGLTELHESREFYKDGEATASRAETLALNMAIEANRLGGEARRIADMATELHRRIQALHAINQKSQALLQLIERRIEPWSTDADMAVDAFGSIQDTTALLGQHIRDTLSTLGSQARLIHELDEDLGDRRASPAAETQAVPKLPAKLPDPLPPLHARRQRLAFSGLRHRFARRRAG